MKGGGREESRGRYIWAVYPRFGSYGSFLFVVLSYNILHYITTRYKINSHRTRLRHFKISTSSLKDCKSSNTRRERKKERRIQTNNLVIII